MVKEIIKRDYHKELREKEGIRMNLEKQLKKSEQKLNNLIDFLTDGILDREEYKLKKKEIMIGINNYKCQIEELDKNREYRLDVTEKLFDFVMLAKTKFNHGDLKAKRIIFSALGENFIFKDGKLAIELHSWLKHIEKDGKKCKREYRRLETKKKGINFSETNTLKAKFLLWYSKHRQMQTIGGLYEYVRGNRKKVESMTNELGKILY